MASSGPSSESLWQTEQIQRLAARALERDASLRTQVTGSDAEHLQLSIFRGPTLLAEVTVGHDDDSSVAYYNLYEFGDEDLAACETPDQLFDEIFEAEKQRHAGEQIPPAKWWQFWKR